MGKRKVAQGPTGERAAANLARLRKRRGLSLQDLAGRLSELDRPILPSGLSKIEQGDRRLDVDDLVALAVALNVSPAWLLAPATAGDDEASIVGPLVVSAWRAWQWFDGACPLPTAKAEVDEQAAFREARPPSLRRQEDHQAASATRTLYNRVLRTVSLRGPAFIHSLKLARQDLVGVGTALDELENEEDRQEQQPGPTKASTLGAAVRARLGETYYEETS